MCHVVLVLQTVSVPFPTSPSADEPISADKNRSNPKDCPHCLTTISDSTHELGLSVSSPIPMGEAPCSCIIRETPLLGTGSHPFLLLLPIQRFEELRFCDYYLFLLLELIFNLEVVLCLESKYFSRGLGVSSVIFLLYHFSSH